MRGCPDSSDVLLPRGSKTLVWITMGALVATMLLLPFSSTHVEAAVSHRRRFSLLLLQVRVPRRRGRQQLSMSVPYLEMEGAEPGEHQLPLILCATLGGPPSMAGGIDLITIFIGLETMAISFYILAVSLKPTSARTRRQ